MTEEIDLRPSWPCCGGCASTARRGRKPSLTLADITRAAVELADAEGLAAVSMARVAERLGNSTMALYRHVKSKDELLLLMSDAAHRDAGAVAGGRRLADRADLLGRRTCWRSLSAGTAGTRRSRSRAARRTEQPRVVRRRPRRAEGHGPERGDQARRRDGVDDLRARRDPPQHGTRGEASPTTRTPSAVQRHAGSRSRSASAPSLAEVLAAGVFGRWSRSTEPDKADFDLGLQLFLTASPDFIDRTCQPDAGSTTWSEELGDQPIGGVQHDGERPGEDPARIPVNARDASLTPRREHRDNVARPGSARRSCSVRRSSLRVAAHQVDDFELHSRDSRGRGERPHVATRRGSLVRRSSRTARCHGARPSLLSSLERHSVVIGEWKMTSGASSSATTSPSPRSTAARNA